MDRKSLIERALRAAGWQAVGEKPTIPKFVCIGVPHTSNWDGVLFLAMAEIFGVESSWMIKDAWLKGPLGAVFERLGAVKVDRSRGSSNLVAAMIEEFRRRDRFILVIPPEGTRGRADRWRSGFYHIARGAQVPVVPAYMDYARKRCGFGPPIDLTGDVRADMDRIRAFYAATGAVGCRPEDVGPMRLKEEDA